MSLPSGPTPSVGLVLPCLDEEIALPALLAAVPADWRVVVVDNNSTDRTAAVAREHGARVIVERQPGYGAAVHAGIVATEAEIVAVIDGDGSLDPAELPELVRLVSTGTADLVCGRRRPTTRRVWPWHARLGTLLLATLIRRGSGVAVHDIAPVRVAYRKALLGLGLRDRRCGYPLETVLAAARRGWRIVEVDVAYGPRAAGSRSKISGTVRGTWVVAQDFATVLRRRRQLGGPPTKEAGQAAQTVPPGQAAPTVQSVPAEDAR